MASYELSEQANRALNTMIFQIISCATTSTDNPHAEVALPYLSDTDTDTEFRHQLNVLRREVNAERLHRKQYLSRLTPNHPSSQEPIKKQATSTLYDPASFDYEQVAARFGRMEKDIGEISAAFKRMENDIGEKQAEADCQALQAQFDALNRQLSKERDEAERVIQERLDEQRAARRKRRKEHYLLMARTEAERLEAEAVEAHRLAISEAEQDLAKQQERMQHVNEGLDLARKNIASLHANMKKIEDLEREYRERGKTITFANEARGVEFEMGQVLVGCKRKTEEDLKLAGENQAELEEIGRVVKQTMDLIGANIRMRNAQEQQRREGYPPGYEH